MVHAFSARVPGHGTNAGFTKLDADILAATWMENQAGFSLVTEQRERALVWDVNHSNELGRERSQRHAPGSTVPATLGVLSTKSGFAGPSFLTGRLPPLTVAAKFNPAHWELRPW